MSERRPLPPNQQLLTADKWPIIGEKTADPARAGEPWTVTVDGLVERTRAWTLDDLRSLPQESRTVDVHCVTRWSRYDMELSGVPLRHLLDACRPCPEARFLSFEARSARGHSTSLPLADALALDTFVVLGHAGKPLVPEHGGPVRTFVAGRYFYKSVKWLERVEVLAEDRLGFWERDAGYHNVADPWREERYLVPDISAADYRDLLLRRRFAGRDLRGLRAEGRNLAGLDARGALLRDAHFEGCDLRGARFDGANLSNAHLEGADLRGATFGTHDGRPADCEGADFRGADLRGLDLRGVALFGATFRPLPASVGEWGPARLDASTVFSEATVEALAPEQQELVRTATVRRGP